MRTYNNAGFTLIELLAVMAIIAILAVLGVVSYSKFQKSAEEFATKGIMDGLKAKTLGLELADGDFPLDNFSKLGATTGNETNIGIEALVAQLNSTNGGRGSADVPAEEELINTDDDKFNKKITKYAKQDAYEVSDKWKNPIVYFNRRSYGKKQSVVAKRHGSKEYEEQLVSAVVDPDTKTFRAPGSYQLISAGWDGVFGTDDDILITGNN
ncbi:MAG: type II secretion system protein [Planctomycetes bacterium]|nr:type II secretion system protein [Planctomycetota bacterium]